MEITVLNRQRAHPASAAGLARFLRRLARELPPPRGDGFSVCLVSDRRMRGFNREYRGVDRATDVLAFVGDGAPDPDGRIYLGDIVISVATARRQARERGHTLVRELRLLGLHGYLHLLGYDHERDGGRMLRLQRKLLQRLAPAPAKGKSR